MKNIFILVLLFLFSVSLFSQVNVRTTFPETETIIEANNTFKIKLKYELNPTQIQNTINTITQIMGNSIGTKPYWVSPKTAENFYSIKVLNGGVFIKGFDSSDDKKLKTKLLQLQEALQPFKRNP